MAICLQDRTGRGGERARDRADWRRGTARPRGTVTYLSDATSFASGESVAWLRGSLPVSTACPAAVGDTGSVGSSGCVSGNRWPPAGGIVPWRGRHAARTPCAAPASCPGCRPRPLRCSRCEGESERWSPPPFRTGLASLHRTREASTGDSFRNRSQVASTAAAPCAARNLRGLAGRVGLGSRGHGRPEQD